jgi:hypothetical protein
MMAKRRKKKSGDGSARRSAGKLLTLGEVARRAGVSIPTAQSYKRKYQNRLPSVGEGRKQRYELGAVAVFQELRTENAGRRGGRRAGGAVGKAAAASPVDGVRGQALSLAEIARRTRNSYPTLLRYLQVHSRAIPSIGSGRTRRFPARAVAVFEKLRSQSRGGRKRATESGIRTGVGTDPALSARIRKIESMQTDLARQLTDLVRVLKQPLQVTIRPQ